MYGTSEVAILLLDQPEYTVDFTYNKVSSNTTTKNLFRSEEAPKIYLAKKKH